MINTPRVGIAVLIVHENRVLIGKRNKPPMIGSWQLPGGWLPEHSTPEQAVAGKVAGFRGLEVDEAHFVAMTDNHFDNGLHSITLYFQMNCLSGLNVMPLELAHNVACDDWHWALWGDFPRPLFLPLQRLVESGFRL